MQEVCAVRGSPLSKHIGRANTYASDGTCGLVRTYLVSVEHVLKQSLYEPGDD